MLSQLTSWPEYVSTNNARQRDSFQMVCFNVVSNSCAVPFFSTHFANITFPEAFSIWNSIFAFLHHWLHLLIKLLRFCRYKTWYGFSIFCQSCDLFGLIIFSMILSLVGSVLLIVTLWRTKKIMYKGNYVSEVNSYGWSLDNIQWIVDK